MNEVSQITQQLSQEIRRGLLVLCVLAALEEKQYGYSLVQKLETSKIKIEGNTLYPLLRRLESQELLESVWEIETTKPRKYYTITSKGNKVLEVLKEYWHETISNINIILGGNENESKND